MPRQVPQDRFGEFFRPGYAYIKVRDVSTPKQLQEIEKLDKRQEQATGMAVLWITNAIEMREDDETLWSDFRGAFHGFNEEVFELISRRAKQDLRDFLLSRGVYFEWQENNLNPGLHSILLQEKFHEWTPEQVAHQLVRCPLFYSRYDTTPEVVITGTTPALPPIPPIQTPLPPIPSTQMPLPTFAPPDQNAYPTFNQAPGYQNPYQAAGYQAAGYQNPFNRAPPAPAPTHLNPHAQVFPGIPNTYAQQEQIYRAQFDNQNNFGLSNLVKAYKDKHKYSGKDDFLDQKVLIFYELCKQCNVPPDKLPDAFSTMLINGALDYYFSSCAGRNLTLQQNLSKIKAHFETDQRQQGLLDKWQGFKLRTLVNDPENSGKSLLEVYDDLIYQLETIQHGLKDIYKTDWNLRDRIIGACKGVRECERACFDPPERAEEVKAKLRNAIGTVASRVAEEREYGITPSSSTFISGQSDESFDAFYTDRNFRGSQHRATRDKKCICCDKVGCWSNKHTKEEQKKAWERVKAASPQQKWTKNRYHQFLSEYEGEPRINDIELLISGFTFKDEGDSPHVDDTEDMFITQFGDIDGYEAITLLNDNSTMHEVTHSQPYQVFTMGKRYGPDIFRGVAIDTCAAEVSTAGLCQLRALQRVKPEVKFDTSRAGEHTVKFGKGSEARSLGTVDVPD